MSLNLSPRENEAASYDYFQLFRLYLLDVDSRQGDIWRLRPSLSLGFSKADIHSWYQDEFGKSIELNFFGLYGVASPLPNFYTEDLMDQEAEGCSAARDFLDIFHDRLYRSLFKVYAKHNLAWIQERTRTPQQVLRYASLEGELPDVAPDALLSRNVSHLAALLVTRPRSLAGLQQLLKVYFSLPITVQACVPRRYRVAIDDKMTLGHATQKLGCSGVLGSSMSSAAHHIVIHVPEQEAWQLFLPGEMHYLDLCQLLERFCESLLDIQLSVSVPKAACQPIVLGRKGRIGRTGWLMSGVKQGNNPYRRMTSVLRFALTVMPTAMSKR